MAAVATDIVEKIRVGDVVEVHGLQGAAALNGQRGRVVRFVSETSRFGVRLDGEPEAKAFRAVNLRCVRDTPVPKLSGGKPGDGWVRPEDVAAHTPSPNLPPSTIGSANLAPSSLRNGCIFSNESEYPDVARAYHAAKALAVAVICGVIVSEVQVCPATWFVWSLLAVHVLGTIFLPDVSSEEVLLALCAAFGLHMGVALSQLRFWLFGLDCDASSVGAWSLVVLFSSARYVHNFLSECMILPPDIITGVSFFFPMFPAYNAAVVLSCLEFFLEWRYYPQYKFWRWSCIIGTVLMTVGQLFVALAVHTCGRNAWASCRDAPPGEESDDSFVGLEIPDRRVVREGIFGWERHPAYFGGLLWGVGCQLALCNPAMLLIVAAVLWASLLYVALEEEQELFEEFKESYAEYAALTRCRLPMFNSFLANAAFQRELAEKFAGAEGQADSTEGAEAAEGADSGEEDPPGDDEEADVQSEEDEFLPNWEGIPKGGVLWNRQFREPWILG